MPVKQFAQSDPATIPGPRRGRHAILLPSGDGRDRVDRWSKSRRPAVIDARGCHMSFLDRVTKAVGDAVDRGKKEVDQFVQIQRINGQIADLEGTIKQCRERIEEATLKIGKIAVEMLRAGNLASPEMQALLDEITRIERGVGEAECQIAGKKAEIEQIRAEASTEKSPEASAAQPQPEAPYPVPTAPPTRACPQCGAEAGETGSFCSQCGARLA